MAAGDDPFAVRRRLPGVQERKLTREDPLHPWVTDVVQAYHLVSRRAQHEIAGADEGDRRHLAVELVDAIDVAWIATQQRAGRGVPDLDDLVGPTAGQKPAVRAQARPRTW